MKILLLPLLLLFTNLCNSQSKQVTIIGTLPQQYDGKHVSFCKPIGKYAISWSYVDSNDDTMLINDKFIKNIEMEGPGIIGIYEKPFNGTIAARFFAEPGDTVIIERINGEIVFKGKNAIVNKMHSDVKLAPVAFNDVVYDIFKNNATAAAIIEKISAIKKEQFKFHDELYQRKQVSKPCLEYTKLLIEHSIDVMVLNLAMNEKFRTEQKMPLPIEEAVKISVRFNSKYLGYNKENLRSPHFSGILRCNLNYLADEAVNEKRISSGFWNQFEGIFARVDNFGEIDYLVSEEYKEVAVGQFLLGLIKSYDNEKTVKYSDLVKVYKAFAGKFPNSPYIIPLSKSIMDKALINLNSAVSDNEKVKSKIQLGNLAVYDQSLGSVGTTPFAQSNQSLLEALNEKFPNQDVFVDLWATWCGPCLKQFAYNKELHAFLVSKNVKTLYVSFDKEEDISKWEKYIGDYKLQGYHFLAGKAYQEKYLNPLSEVIPRYYFYDSKAKSLKPLEGYPNERESFYANITKALPAK